MLSAGINSLFAGRTDEQMFIGAIEQQREIKGGKLFQFSPFFYFFLHRRRQISWQLEGIKVKRTRFLHAARVCAEGNKTELCRASLSWRVHKLLVFLAKWGWSCKKINNPLMDVATAAAINGLFPPILADSIFSFKTGRRLGILSAFKVSALAPKFH